jgi:GT2 family glycosyltransferase
MAERRPEASGMIGIVTVTFNSESVLPEFLDSLTAQTDRNWILYVVDNASGDSTLELCRAAENIPQVTIANAKNLGVAEGNNQGIRKALADGCDSILLLNNDTILAPDLLEKLRSGLGLYNCDMTTCKIYYANPPDLLWCAGGRFKWWRGYSSAHDGGEEKDRGQYDTPRRIDYCPTCCLLARKSVFERAGMMDDQYFAYYDDTDFLLRCRKLGLTLWYLPQGNLWHKVSSLTSATSDFTARQYARNYVYFVRKHLPGWRAHLWAWIDQLKFALSVVLGRSSIARWRLRRAAAREGWQMPLPRPDATEL